MAIGEGRLIDHERRRRGVVASLSRKKLLATLNHLRYKGAPLRVGGEHPLDEVDELPRVRGAARKLSAADHTQVRALDHTLHRVLGGGQIGLEGLASTRRGSSKKALRRKSKKGSQTRSSRGV